jgi:hypothetical protein
VIVREQLAGQTERPAPATRLVRVSHENPGGGEPDILQSVPPARAFGDPHRDEIAPA